MENNVITHFFPLKRTCQARINKTKRTFGYGSNIVVVYAYHILSGPGINGKMYF